MPSASQKTTPNSPSSDSKPLLWYSTALLNLSQLTKPNAQRSNASNSPANKSLASGPTSKSLSPKSALLSSASSIAPISSLAAIDSLPSKSCKASSHSTAEKAGLRNSSRPPKPG